MAAYFPGPQGVQLTCPMPDIQPSGQFQQAFAPRLVLARFPSEHKVQSRRPGLDAYFPG